MQIPGVGRFDQNYDIVHSHSKVFEENFDLDKEEFKW